MNIKTLRTIGLVTCLATPLWALAHTGADLGGHHAVGLMDGFLHPMMGVDHLCAMLAVGVWCALTARRLWTMPLTFALMLLAGALLGLAGFAMPSVEPMIASSLLVLGLMVALRAHLTTFLSATLVGVFAVFHGVAHGTELAGGNSFWAPLTGMLLGTVLLHACGLVLGLALRSRGPWWPRVVGTTVTALGGALLLQLI